jgi:hypothetical protein
MLDFNRLRLDKGGKNMEKEIVEIENAVIRAQLADDVAYFERMLSDDFRFVTPHGKIVTKREDIDQYKTGYLRLLEVDVDDRTIDIYGDAAVVRFRVKFKDQAGKYPFCSAMRMTRIYSKHSGKWKMVAGHSSETIA